MKALQVLPEGYKEIFSVNLQKNKKTAVLINTVAVVIGLIMGISATFSMASSEFLAAKSEGRNDALKSCSYTGVAYLITVALLILPYLIFDNSNYMTALFSMIGVVILIIDF